MRPDLPSPITLNLQQRLTLLQAIATPSTKQKWQIIDLLLRLDRFDEAVALYRNIGEANTTAATQLLAARALRGSDTLDHQAEAETLLRHLLDRPLDDALQSRVLVELGDILRRRGDYDAASERLLDALAIDPTYSTAIRKYAVIQADTGNFAALLAQSEKLIAKGGRQPRLVASYVTALAALGREDEARAIRGEETLLRQTSLEPPEGFADLAAFNDRLNDELKRHPSLRYENSLRASSNSWRIDELYMRNGPMVKRLLDRIADMVEDHLRALADLPPHQFFEERRPETARISPWAVLTGAQGHEKWHVHADGWISGVYYSAVPETIVHGTDKAGAIGFGWSERLLGEGASEKLGEKIIHPAPGMLLLFPSWLHHRTWPHGLEEERICISFDIVPSRK
ncbi:MAG: putative 2OG-Fe(II) oxygenase [Pseudomonadota bacterium]